ncbi:MAG TPA: ATP-binding protein [Bacteroidia bacterium]|jgi:signal transduction histidine kinase|nr:ATP-binding protein [Bacteroidia bacterium]
MSAEKAINILLVDDRKEDLLSMEVILGDPKYTFYKAASGREALRLLLKEKDFAIILIDVQMPQLNGYETTTLIRESENLKHIPIIFLTANNDKPNHVFEGYQAGAVDYMIKPVIPEILRAKVSVFADLYRKTKELQIQKQELELRTAELVRSNRDLEKFAYVASHDMQEPLRTIISYIELIEKKLAPVSAGGGEEVDEDLQKYMDFVVDAGYRMRELITGLLEYSQVDRDSKPSDKINCEDVLNDVIENLHSSIEDSKAVIQHDSLPQINANYMRMVQLFQNLISNSIKFKRDIPLTVNISCRKKEGNYLFSIEDNGIGIKPDYNEKIFELFKRLHPIGEYIGAGIGLAICKKIVERHNGKIWVESLPDKGSTFFFTIPHE